MAVNIERNNKVVIHFKSKCILCGAELECFTGDGKDNPYKWKDQLLEQHLTGHHQSSTTFLKLQTSQLPDTPTVHLPEQQPLVTNFFSKRQKTTPVPVENISVIPATSVETERIPIPVSIDHINRLDVMKTMRIIMSNIALSWNNQGVGADLYWKSELATYYESNKMIPRLYNCMRYYIKELMRSIPDYSYSCDCWSVANIKFKAICFFVHFYYRNSFVSLLLDVKRIDNSKAESIKDIFLQVVKDYGLDTNKYITTDNARSNENAFGDFRIGCLAHRINTACTHLTTKSSKIVGGLSVMERKILADFFNTAEHICHVFRGHMWDVFEIWCNKYLMLFPDLQDVKIRKPTKPCQTRWIGRLVYLDWLRECGVAAFRFLSITGSNGIDLVAFHECLIQVPMVLSLLNIMNNALELLAVEKESSAHLVIPLLHHMKQVFSSEQYMQKRRGDNARKEGVCELEEEEEEEEEEDGLFEIGNEETCSVDATIPDLILKCFRYELNEGCLKLSEKEERIFKAAACCFVRVRDFSPEVFKLCEDEGRKKYKEYVVAKPDLARAYYSYDGFLNQILGSLRLETYPEDKSPFRKALIYRKDGDEGVYLKGIHSNDFNPSYAEYYNMNIRSLGKKRGSLQRALNNGRTKNKEEIKGEIAFIDNMINIRKTKLNADVCKSYVMTTGRYEVVSGVSSYVGMERVDSLYNMMTERLFEDNPISLADVKKWMQACLHYPATESACERFFRQLSLIVKKQYRTNMNGDKSCQISFLHYYAVQVYYLLGTGRENNHDLGKIFTM